MNHHATVYEAPACDGPASTNRKDSNLCLFVWSVLHPIVLSFFNCESILCYHTITTCYDLMYGYDINDQYIYIYIYHLYYFKLNFEVFHLLVSVWSRSGFIPMTLIQGYLEDTLTFTSLD